MRRIKKITTILLASVLAFANISPVMANITVDVGGGKHVEYDDENEIVWHYGEGEHGGNITGGDEYGGTYEVNTNTGATGGGSILIHATVDGKDPEVIYVSGHTDNIYEWYEDKDFIKDHVANPAIKTKARNLIDSTGLDTYILAFMERKNVKDSEINRIKNDNADVLITSDFENYDVVNVFDLSLRCFAYQKELDPSSDLPVNKLIGFDDEGNPITTNIMILHPYGFYDKEQFVVSEPIVRLYTSAGGYETVDLSKSEYSAAGYDIDTDILTIPVNKMGRYFIWFEKTDIDMITPYDVQFEDATGGVWYTYEAVQEAPRMPVFYNDFDENDANIVPDKVIMPVDTDGNPVPYPQKEETHDSTYVFKGWKNKIDKDTALNAFKEAGRPANDYPMVVYEPEYNTVPRLWVRWIGPGNIQIAEQEINADPIDITRPKAFVEAYKGDSQFKGTEDEGFIGWTSSLDDGTENEGKLYDTDELTEKPDRSVVYTAQFDKWKYKSVVYKSWNGDILAEKELKENTDGSYDFEAGAPEAPKRPDTDDTTYTFVGWDLSFEDEERAVLTAAYLAERLYTIRFVDWDGKLLDSGKYKYGDMPKCKVTPTRSGYKFIGWSKEGIGPVTCEVTYTAQYRQVSSTTPTPVPTDTPTPTKTPTPIPTKTPTPRPTSSPSKSDDNHSSNNNSSSGGGDYVNVVFRDWDGTELKKQTVPRGYKLEPPTVPSFTLNGYQFDFLSWVPGQPDTPQYDGYAHGYDTYKATYYAHAVGSTAGTSASTGTSKGSASGGTASSTSRSSGTDTKSSTDKPEKPEREKIDESKLEDMTTANKDMFERAKKAQDEARIRFIPHQYYGNITDFTVFEEALPPEQKKTVEDVVEQNKKQAIKKAETKEPLKQINENGNEEPVEPVSDDDGWFKPIYLLGLIPILAVIAFLIYKKKKDDNADEDY